MVPSYRPLHCSTPSSTYGWNVLDGVIVITSLAMLAESSSSRHSLKSLRSLRTFRAFRPLRVISRRPGLKLVVNALIEAIPAVLNVLIICALFYLIFSIFAVTYLKGRLNSCSGDVFNALSADQVDFLVNPQPWPTLSFDQQQWFTNTSCIGFLTDSLTSRYLCECWGADWGPVVPQNFDNVGNAMITFFEMSTTENWGLLMVACIDATGIDMQPIRDYNMWWAGFFVVFMMFGSFFVVIIDNFNKMRDALGGAFMLSSEQKKWIKAQKAAAQVGPQLILKPFPDPIRRKIFHLEAIRVVHHDLHHYQHATYGCTALRPSHVADNNRGILQRLLCHDIHNRSCIEDHGLRACILRGQLEPLRLLRSVRYACKHRTGGFHYSPRSITRYAGSSLPRDAYHPLGQSFQGDSPHSDDAVLGSTRTQQRHVDLGAHALHLHDDGRANVRQGGVKRQHRHACQLPDVLDGLSLQDPSCDWRELGHCMHDFAARPEGCVDDPPYDPSMCDFNKSATCVPLNGCGNPIAYLFVCSFTLLGTYVMLNVTVAVILESFSVSNEDEEPLFDPELLGEFQTKWAEVDPKAKGFIPVAKLYAIFTILDPPLVKADAVRDKKAFLRFVCGLRLPMYEGDTIYFTDTLLAMTREMVKEVRELEESDFAQTNR